MLQLHLPFDQMAQLVAAHWLFHLDEQVQSSKRMFGQVRDHSFRPLGPIGFRIGQHEVQEQ